MKWIPEIPIWFSLGFIATTIIVATALSLWKTRTMSKADAAADDGKEPAGVDTH